MPWGHRWQAMYDPFWDGPAQKRPFARVTCGTYIRESILVEEPAGTLVTVRWRGGNEPRRFERCDFSLSVGPESFVTDCQFIRCRFKGSLWEGVRFSNCRFEQCDFSEVTIKKCYFVNTCTFDRNTASPQKFRLEDTAISASAFMAGLQANLEYESIDLIGYSRFKFAATRQKIAKTIYSATRNEPDVDYYFEAYEQLTRCTLTENVERYRYNDATKEKIPQRNFWLLSLLPRVDRWVVLLSGWLTNWGRSISKAMCIFLGLVSLFTALYFAATLATGVPFWHKLFSSLREAINVTLVVGYTAEFHPELPRIMKIIMIINVIIGLAWYALIIPTITRRILR